MLFSSFCLVNAFLHWNLWGFRRPEIRWMEIVAYLKKIYIILLGSGLYFDTHMKAWECALHWPWSWEGPEKRMWGWERQLRYSMWLLNLVFQVLTVTPRQVCDAAWRLQSTTEQAAAQEAACADLLSHRVLCWGYACQPTGQSTMRL